MQSQRRLLAALAMVVLTVGSTQALLSSPANAAETPGRFYGFAGEDRIATAAIVAANVYPRGAQRVYLARADSFPDALAGASLGGGPILLVPSDGAVPAYLVNLVTAFDPVLVVAFGASGAISDAVLGQVAQGRPTERLGGATRFDTAVEISRFGFVGGAREVYLARSDDFADALAAGSLHGGPVLLVPRSGPVPGAVRAEIARLGPERVLALGGTQAVPDSVLFDAAVGLPTGRLAGADRYATAVAIAQHASAPAPGGIVTVVSGANFPDGLAAGGIDKGPVLLVPPCGELPAAVDVELQARRPRSLALLGGPSAICDEMLARVASAANVVGAGTVPFDENEPDAGDIVGTTWVSMPIRYEWGAGTEDLPEWRSVIERAMASWEALGGGLDFAPANGGPVDLVIGFSQGCHEPNVPGHPCFDGAGPVLAHATLGDVTPATGDLHFDDAQFWVDSLVPAPGQIDLETVALHELGHVLGLHHLPQPTAVMYEAYTVPHRTLTPDDVNALRALYPSIP